MQSYRIVDPSPHVFFRDVRCYLRENIFPGGVGSVIFHTELFVKFCVCFFLFVFFKLASTTQNTTLSFGRQYCSLNWCFFLL